MEENEEYPAEGQDILRLGKQLEGKKIALCITGGIAAYKTPSLVRHFRQYGADVHVYITKEGTRYVAEDSLEWTSRNSVVVELSARAEHLYDFDAYVVAPATLNCIGQMAEGKANDAVTTTLASALGRLTRGKAAVLVAPAMHGTMEDNPACRQNLDRLKSFGVKIIRPIARYGKANLPDSHTIVVETIRELCKSPLKGKRILVTAGPTPGKIDNERIITSRFRGRLGTEIAREAYMRGAQVKLILGPGGIEAPSYLDVIPIRDFYEYCSKVMDILERDVSEVGIFSAAVADYIPSKVFDGKIPSDGTLKSIRLQQTSKVIQEVRRKFPDLYMVTFKYEENVSKRQLEKIARARAKEGYQLVVANRGEDMHPEGDYRCIIVHKNEVVAEPQSKQECARSILDLLEKAYVC